MINIIRADIYRIVRGKGLYITLAAFLVMIILQTVGGANMNAGVNTDALDMFSIDLANINLEELSSQSFDISDLFSPPTGREAPFQVMSATSNILYVLLPLLIFVGVADFSSGSARNTLAGGVSRGKYFCSKLILSCAFCVLLLIIYVVFSVIAATVRSGFGGAFNGEFVLDVAKIFLPQLLLCLAGACVGNFFVFLFRSHAVTGVFIAFMLVPSILLLVLSFISSRFERLYEYELTASIGALTQIGTMSSGEITKTLLVGAGYIILAIAGGLAVFKRAEVK